PPPPLLVVEVLSPAGVVGSGRLEVAFLVRADPYLPPGRGDGERSDPAQPPVADATAMLIEVDESAPPAPPRVAGGGLRDAMQASHGRGNAQIAAGPNSRLERQLM